MIDIALMPTAAVDPLEYDRRIGAVVIVIFEVDTDVRSW
jgi:hypothetical protein